MRNVRLSVATASYLLGGGLYVTGVVFGTYSFIHFLLSLIPIAGLLYWLRVGLLTQGLVSPFVIACAVWVILLAVGLLIGAFRQPVRKEVFAYARWIVATAIAGRVGIVVSIISIVLALLLRVIATTLFFFLPSRSWHIDAGKLAVLGLIVTTFFLFTSIYFFPGGAHHFTEYAVALVNGTKLNTYVAQRDIGYPFLLLLSGYTIFGSFIGVTLIEAVFAILMPVLVYCSIRRASPAAALYAGAATILSLAPIYFFKWIHHDQAFVFFTILVIATLANFLQSRKNVFLYCFTIAALAASFTRPAGNLLFPVLLVVAYITVRGRIVHYLACLLIFISAATLYQWHRYEIFDMRNQASVPSYSGQQIFYNLYINSAELGIRISPDIGPNLKHVTEVLREKLQPNLRESVYLQKLMGELPPAFIEENVYALHAGPAD